MHESGSVHFHSSDKWAIAVQPGGAEWLLEHHFGDGVAVTRTQVEYVKVRGADGKVSYEARPQRKSPRKAHK